MRRTLTRILAAGAVAGLAFALGYLLSSQAGRELLAREVEAQLSDLLQAEVEADEVRFTWRGGPGLEGRRVRCCQGPEGPALTADRVHVQLRLSALLLGQVRFARLSLEGLSARIDRDGEGRLHPAVLQPRGNEASPADPDELAGLTGVERVARALFEGPRVADTIELRDGRLRYRDQKTPGAPSLQLERIDGSVTRDLFGGGAALSLRGHLLEADGRRVALELSGSREGGGDDGEVRLTLAATEADAGLLAPWLDEAVPGAALRGRVSGTLSMLSREPAHAGFELDWIARELVPTFAVRGAPVTLDLPFAELRARLEVHPGRVRLASAEAIGPRLGLRATGVIERPMHPAALARLSVEILGADYDEALHVVEQLPEADRRAFLAWFERFESGQVDVLRASGAARIERWRQLLAGELASLPASFLLHLRVSDVRAVVGDERVDDLRFSVDWSRDRMELHDLRARIDDEASPALDLRVDGVSRLLDGAPERRVLRPGAGSLPGLPLLVDRLVPKEDDGADPPLPRSELHVAALHHPLTRWPLESARFAFRPTDEGAELSIPEARWAGVPIRGEVVYAARVPEPRVTINVEVLEADADSAKASPPVDAAPPWLDARFELGPLEAGLLHAKGVQGRISGDGDAIALSEVAFALGTGTAEGALSIDLGHADTLPVQASLEIEGARLSELGRGVGLPEGLASGEVSAHALVAGSLAPGEPLLGSLSGAVELEVRDGQVRRKLPLVAAMAQATEGFNPEAAREALNYESVTAQLLLNQGVLSSGNFELEGPIQVYAEGWVDFRRPPYEIDAVVGVFLFRRVDRAIGSIPLVKAFIPGSKRGLVGAYFGVTGPFDEPEVETLTMKTIAEELPDVVTAPFKVLGALFLRERQPPGPARLDEATAP